MLDKRQVTELLPAFTASLSILRALWHYGVPALDKSGDCDLKMPPLCGSFQRLVAARAEEVIPSYSQVPWHSLPDQLGDLTALQEILAGNRHSC